MSSKIWDQYEIDKRRRKLNKARKKLAKAVRKACPGPHETKQHRDRRPPWCRSCHRTDDGRSVIGRMESSL